MSLQKFLNDMPVVAILRGLSPDEAVDVADVLAETGIRIIEVPLNSPDPFVSIGRIADAHGERCLVGAGTVLRADDVDRVADAGGRIVVAPNFNAGVVSRAGALGLISAPGVQTPTEAFAALDAGADGLKLFPAEIIPARAVRAMRAVLPVATTILAVGGIGADNMADYRKAGVDGFGVGSSLYKPGMTIAEVTVRAQAMVAAASALPAVS